MSWAAGLSIAGIIDNIQAAFESSDEGLERSYRLGRPSFNADLPPSVRDIYYAMEDVSYSEHMSFRLFISLKETFGITTLGWYWDHDDTASIVFEEMDDVGNF